jgi:hypothetical protein
MGLAHSARHGPLSCRMRGIRRIWPKGHCRLLSNDASSGHESDSASQFSEIFVLALKGALPYAGKATSEHPKYQPRFTRTS